MPKHADTALLAAEIGRLLNGAGVRPFDGHVTVDSAENGTVTGRVLHAHDESELVAFSLAITVT